MVSLPQFSEWCDYSYKLSGFDRYFLMLYSNHSSKSKYIMKRDACSPLSGYHTIKIMTTKNWNFPRALRWDKRKAEPLVPARGRTCFPGRNFTQFWHCRTDQKPGQWWVSYRWEHTLSWTVYMGINNPCPLFKPPKWTWQTLNFFIVPLLNVGRLNKSPFSASHYCLSP